MLDIEQNEINTVAYKMNGRYDHLRIAHRMLLLIAPVAVELSLTYYLELWF